MRLLRCESGRGDVVVGVDVDVDVDGFGVEFLEDFRVLEGRDHCVGLLQGERRCHLSFSPTERLSCSIMFSYYPMVQVKYLR